MFGTYIPSDFHFSKMSDGILYNLQDMLLIWLIVVCNAHIKIFVLHMRNKSFIFIIYLYYHYKSLKKIQASKNNHSSCSR